MDAAESSDDSDDDEGGGGVPGDSGVAPDAVPREAVAITGQPL